MRFLAVGTQLARFLDKLVAVGEYSKVMVFRWWQM